MQKPIRILQVGMSPNYGGTEAFVMAQYRKIDKERIQFDFLNVYSEKIACQEEIEAMGGQIFYLDMARHKGIKNYKKNLDDFFAANAKCFDCVHCNFQSLINIDILKYAKRYNIPVRIAHAHNSGYGQEPALLQKVIIQRNKLFVCRYATHFLACSDMAAKWMFPKGAKATIVNNAIDAESFRFSEAIREKKRKELGISDDCLTILFVGRLDPQKNPMFLLDIFKCIAERKKSAKLLIAGDGILKESMQTNIKNNDLCEKVELLGNRSDINELMQAADAFLLPSKFEGLGIVLVEAQAAGLPCFASADVIPENVNITGAVRFIPLSETPYHWSMTILKESSSKQVRPDMYMSICENGYDSVVNAKKLEKLYYDALEKQVI